MNEKWFTTDEVAKHFRIVHRTVFRYIEDGLLRGTKIGKGWQFTEQDIAECTEKLRERSKQELLARAAQRAERKSIAVR